MQNCLFLLFDIYETEGGWEGKGGWQTNQGLYLFIFILSECSKNNSYIYVREYGQFYILNSIAGNKVFSANQTLLGGRG